MKSEFMKLHNFIQRRFSISIMHFHSSLKWSDWQRLLGIFDKENPNQ